MHVASSSQNMVSSATHRETSTHFFHPECEDGEILLRIVANTAFLGPIEVCFHNKFHRVCDSNWTTEDARVSCRQLELDHEGTRKL